MYPRNAASPERISIGAVVQISDGAVQSSGVTVRIIPFGGSEADGAGTPAYSTDGVVLYTPTQAETNYTSFVLIAKKTGCIPASVTVVTSASNVAGHTGTDHSKIQNATATVNFSGTAIKTATDVETDTQDIQSRLPASLAGGRMDASVGAYQSGLTPLQPTTAGRTLDVSAGGGVIVSDKTGFSLASNGLASISSWTVSITGNITGNLSGSVGSISGVTFPANFASLGITSSGYVSRVVLVDELGPNAIVANDLGSDVADAVWNSLLTSYTVAGSFGARLVRSTNSNNQVQLTGGNNPHIAAVLHDAEPDSIPEDAFVTGALSARALASDAVGEIADGVWDEAISGHATAGSTGKALIDAGSAGNPWSTDISTGYTGTQAGNVLNSVKTQTDLIQAGGTVYVASPVTATGQLASPLIIGDDYLAANGRKFRWTVPLPSGFVIATSSCKFGMRYEDDQGVNSFIATGTVSDAGGGNVHLDFDVGKATTGTLRQGWYEWSVEIVSASGNEVTRVKSGKNAQWVEKQT